ncbi:GAF domain-containing sensor histidine kinase [Bacillus coahuilensis]|uniref:GAF domain-containing sensor histidine kinase n=1 Tax=Bacillus coahuilensis TaxID=408580 RepID=UPI00018507A4|nr:histidine kinase [Bacillus coahuilensis]
MIPTPHDEILSEAAHTIKQTLRLPYVAIELKKGGLPYIEAIAGASGNAKEVIPLIHGGQEVGCLMIARRSHDEPFTSAELQLLEGLARQVGALAQSVRMTDDLQRLAEELKESRERIVLAREEERRRIRRNLHDDLAPTLAALALKASTAEDLLISDTSGAKLLVKEIRTSIRDKVKDIRKIAYDLRPPAIDELGLVGAIRERALQVNNFILGFGVQRDYALKVEVIVPSALPPLPAAVEVATFWIVQEALLNVVRHSQAEYCTVSLRVEETNVASTLQLHVKDNGIGILQQKQNPKSSGIGLKVMKERVEELGGEFSITANEISVQM